MSYEEIKEMKTYLKLKGIDGRILLEAEIESLGNLIVAIANALNSGQIELESREVTVRRFKPVTISRENVLEGEHDER